MDETAPGKSRGRLRRLRSREKRLLVYLGILLVVAAWRFTPRYWKPGITTETSHFEIASTATREQTDEVGRRLEMLYTAYSNRFAELPRFTPVHPRLKVLLYKDRNEMRRINPGLGWAEAFYKKPYCRAYYSAEEANPFHWMTHEATHQLNEEVAHLHLAKWLEEGLAEYFSTARIHKGELQLGTADPNTYPVWWLDEIATDPALETNLQNGSVIPLRAIVTNRGGPLMRTHVNLYYLHWWTLTHFVFETSPTKAKELIERGGDLESLEKLFGPIETIQTNWHAHVRALKKSLP
jgi:hypothetical protein